MSYDLRIWCVKPLPKSETGAVDAGPGWAVNVWFSACAADDMPDDVRLLGVQYVADLSLEPISAPPEGFAAAWKVARAIAKIAQGVIEDPQQGSFEALPIAQRTGAIGAPPPPAKRKRRGIPAKEVMAGLNANPEYLARRAKREEELEKRLAELRLAEEPLVQELRAAGCAVESVFDFVNRPQQPYPSALPILIEHLSRPYPADLREAIAAALAVPQAKFAWEALLQSYQNQSAEEKRVKETLANTLNVLADDKVIGDVLALVRDTRLGDSRIFLLAALERSKDPRAREALFELQTDPELKLEVEAILRRLKRKRR
jgi:hypothetical protein